MLLLARLYQMTWSLIGVPLMLGGDIHLRPEEKEIDHGTAACEPNASGR